jgi:CRISPR-associated protein Cas2
MATGGSRDATVRVVVAYDISSDRGRQKVAGQLEMVLTRVQRSVFEGDLPPKVLHKSIERTLRHIDPETDSLRVYHLCASCAPRVDVYGRGFVPAAAAVQIL